MAKCPLPNCKQSVKNLKAHLEDHIDHEQALEMEHFQKGNKAKEEYRRLYKQLP